MRLIGRIARRVGGAVAAVVVGRTPTPGGPTPISQSHPLARYNKLLAVPIGAFLGWAATKTGWSWLVENQEEITPFIIGYLVWRFPNALPRLGG